MHVPSKQASKRLPRTWEGPQGPLAPSNLGKGGINNNNKWSERFAGYSRSVAAWLL